jgi:glycosyltransferase involved in cell wall biosynthesis
MTADISRSPSVSVVIPCYRYGHYLEECVRSVLDQPGVDVRVLVIDDCSPDDTPAVAARLAEDPRVEYRRHEHNQGHIATYNEGLLGWATGDYSVLLSADDLLTEGSLARAVRILEERPSVGMVYGRPLRFTDDEPRPVARTSATGAKVWAGHEWVRIICEGGNNTVTSPEVVVRTSLQQRVGGYDPALPHTGDLEMWLRFAAISDIAFIQGADQAYYRGHGRNMSVARTTAVDLEQRLAAFEAAFARHGHDLPDATALERAARRAIAREALWRVCRAYDRDRLDEVPVDELLAFAGRAYADVRRLPEWWGSRWRSLVGRSTMRAVGPYVPSAAVRRTG